MRANRVLVAILVVYAAARIGQAFPNQVPILVTIVFHVIAPLLFALVHGAMRYGIRNMLVFMLLCAAIGNVTENLSIITGFPFGHYHFTNVMGPKILNVPILLGLAYIGMGYICWTLALIILGDFDRPLTGSRLVTRPLIAAFLMVAWDLSMDAIWSNFVHAWTWHDGGAYFGVPLTNFAGWYLTVYLIYQSFALYLARIRRDSLVLPPSYWRSAVAFYGICAIGNLFVLPPRGVATITDASGTSWPVADIFGASELVSISVMGAFAAVAWVRVSERISSAASANCWPIQ